MALVQALSVAALAVACGAAQAQQAAAPAPIERIKLTDNALSCAQIHGETADMDRIAADAKAEEEKHKSSATTASAAGVASEAAARTGLFGQVGGLAGQLFGNVAAQTAAGSARQSSNEAAQKAAERSQQALSRKERLAAMFLAKECRADDLAYAGKPLPAEAAQAPAASAASMAIDVPDLAPGEYMNPVDAGAAQELAKHRRVTVGGFRVAFVTRAVAADNIRASYRGGGVHTSGVNSRVELSLRNIDLARMQALTEQAYREFTARLQQAGVEVIPYEKFAAHKAYAEISFASGADGQAYAVESGGRSYTVLSPSGLKLWFGQGEPLGDQGPFGWGNVRKAGEFAFDNKAVVLNPLLVVDFAETASGRNKGLFGFRNRTDVDVKSAISLRAGQGMTHLAFIARSAPIDAAIAAGNAFLKDSVLMGGDFGQLATREQSSNRALVVGLSALGLSGGPVRETQKDDLMADPARYDALAGAALAAGSRLFARTLAELYRQ